MIAVLPAGLNAGPAEEDEALARLVQAIWEKSEVPAKPPQALRYRPAAVYVALRRQGVRLAQAWSQRASGPDALRDALETARAETSRSPDTVELVIAHGFRPVAFNRWQKTFFNLNRGLIGIEMSHGEKVSLVGPTEVLATNRSFEKIIDRFAESEGIGAFERPRKLALRSFRAEQYLIRLGSEAAAIRLYRGNRVVRGEEISQASVLDLAGRMTAWMERNLQASGRMTYKYWPSNGRESSSNNMIRQWMASLALVRAANFAGDADLAKRAAGNIRYNLTEFYREDGGLGAIEYQEKVKLGALAIASLAMADHPESAAFESYETSLRSTIEHLWEDSGAFRTFLKPEGRNDNQNFYPGEALLYLANHYARTEDSALLARIMKSVAYYRSWHLTTRNPAFVPWHTMAYAVVWDKTQDQDLRDWIFEMNDWLLDVQQQSRIYPDIDGRFFDPKRPHFGPPHASSTGVYLEGLIQAFRLARAAGEEDRVAAYRLAILRGIRSLMQLEFRDEIDLYYISKKDRARGGLRTTVYNNEIRVDNVQHGLMALFDILKIFEPEDYSMK